MSKLVGQTNDDGFHGDKIQGEKKTCCVSCVRVGTDQELSLESSLTGLIAAVIIYQNTTIDMVILSFRDMIKEYFLFEISKTVDPPHARVYTQKVTIVQRCIQRYTKVDNW